MKIKVLAAMMALTSTGAMAELTITQPATLDGAGSTDDVAFTAEATVPNLCVIGSVSGTANLGFGVAPTNSAAFTVLSNAGAEYTIATTTNGTSKLNGSKAEVKYVIGKSTNDLVISGPLSFTNGSATLDIGVMLTEKAHQLKSGAQTVVTTVTIDCAGDTAPEGGESA